MCRAKQIIDRETIEMHLERIRALVSTWAAQVSVSAGVRAACSSFLSPCLVSVFHYLLILWFQPYFSEVEFPESNFVDQVELLMKDPEEKERFFQVCVDVHILRLATSEAVRPQQVSRRGPRALNYVIICSRMFFPQILVLSMTALCRY